MRGCGKPRGGTVVDMAAGVGGGAKGRRGALRAKDATEHRASGAQEMSCAWTIWGGGPGWKSRYASRPRNTAGLAPSPATCSSVTANGSCRGDGSGGGSGGGDGRGSLLSLSLSFSGRRGSGSGRGDQTWAGHGGARLRACSALLVRLPACLRRSQPAMLPRPLAPSPAASHAPWTAVAITTSSRSQLATGQWWRPSNRP
jgi:hypothetical protein